MSFFSRKRHTQQQVPAVANTVSVAQSPSQALAQTRNHAANEQYTSSPIQQQPQPQQQQSSQRARDSTPDGPSSSSRPSNASQSQSKPAYPWSARRLNLSPPLLIPRPGLVPSSEPSPDPFPRYGHSLPLTASSSGDFFLFGGLVRDSVRNDLYSVSARDMTTTLIQTTGEVPAPRVGHASALVSTVLIVWGGDTKEEGRNDDLDNELYMLNLSSKEWSRVTTSGPSPQGRYGHAIAMIGTKLFLFGGQVDGEFLNDLWVFDLASLKGKTIWEHLALPPTAECPAARTGHIMVPQGNTLLIFGGTDGQFHYNDTWAYDLATRSWKELSCIGYIPAPREGHSAALVDDVMYVFGGRGVDGQDLSDLTAFKISNQRWYMFQNMGPSPSGRSGHSMASLGSRVYVLGGESFAQTKPEDYGIVHVLETKHIKYPDGGASKQAPTNGPGRRPSNPSQEKQPQTSPDAQAAAMRAISPTSIATRATSPPTIRAVNGTLSPQLQPIAINGTHVHGQPDRSIGPGRSQRTNTEEDFLSEEDHGEDIIDPHVRQRVLSPDQTTSQMRSKSPPAVTQRAISPEVPHASITAAAMNRAGRSGGRSPSPVVERGAPPADAFYPAGTAKSPAATGVNGFPAGGRPGSIGNVTADLVRDLKGKEVEIESLRKRGIWMRAALQKAVAAGFVADNEFLDQNDAFPEPLSDVNSYKIRDLLESIKKERARLQTALSSQSRISSEQLEEAERVRNAALQEAARYRAKLAAYEANNLNDISRLEREQIAELERKLTASADDHKSRERTLAELSEALSLQTKLRQVSEENAAEAARRTTSLEELHSRNVQEFTALQRTHDGMQTALREHADQLLAHSSAAQQAEADRLGLEAQVESLTESRDQQLRAIEQANLALTAAAARATEVEHQWRTATDQVTRLEADLAELRSEAENRAAEADVAREKLAGVENAWAESRKEADALRAFTTGSLGELLDSHRELKADEDRILRGHNEKLSVVEEEVVSLRALLKESRETVDQLQTDVATHRERSRLSDDNITAMRAQTSGLRAQLSSAMEDAGRLRKDLTSREQEVRDKARQASQTEVRLEMLRNYLAENGMVVEEDDLGARPEAASRLRELEDTLEEYARRTEDADRELELANRRKRDAEAQASQLSAQLDRLRSTQSPSLRGHADEGDPEARAAAAERKLMEIEQSQSAKLQQMEADYEAAVSYIKSHEKMAKRMKEELTKQKNVNASLQSELASASRSRSANGRHTPSSEDGHDALRSHLAETQRQHQRVAAENSSLRRRIEALQEDFETVQHEAEERTGHVEDLRREVERLEMTLAAANRGDGASLAEENTHLRQMNEELAQKVSLLLQVDGSTDYYNQRPLSDIYEQRFSTASSENVVDENDLSNLSDWQKQLSDANTRRRMAELDAEQLQLQSSGHDRTNRTAH